MNSLSVYHRGETSEALGPCETSGGEGTGHTLYTSVDLIVAGRRSATDGTFGSPGDVLPRSAYSENMGVSVFNNVMRRLSTRGAEVVLTPF